MTTDFRTVIKPHKSADSIDYSTSMLFIGSCFSDNISAELARHKFNVLSNPFGVLYNPYSIQTALQLIMGDISIDEKDLIFHNNLWHSFTHHGSFSTTSKEELMYSLEQSITDSRTFLKQADYLFITLGTAWVYRHKNSNRIVANCHKVPNNEFYRFRLNVCDITDEFEMLLRSIIGFNPKIKVVFTISPIRHLADGATENHLSKSILTVSAHQLIELMHNNISYFPAFELVTDDLRDYRFYNSDLIHVSQQAVDYIFDFFCKTYFSAETITLYKSIEQIIKASQHRPINTNSGDFIKFCIGSLNKIEQILSNYPLIDFSKEKSYFERYIKRGLR